MNNLIENEFNENLNNYFNIIKNNNDNSLVSIEMINVNNNNNYCNENVTNYGNKIKEKLSNLKYLKFKYLIIIAINIYFIVNIALIDINKIKNYFIEKDIKFDNFELIIINIISSYLIFNVMIYFFHIKYNIFKNKIKSNDLQIDSSKKEFIKDVLENNNNSNYNDYLVKYYDNIMKYSGITNFLNMNTNNILILVSLIIFYIYLTTVPIVHFNSILINNYGDTTKEFKEKILKICSLILKNSLFVTLYIGLVLIHLIVLKDIEIHKIKLHFYGFNTFIIIFYLMFLKGNIVNLIYVFFMYAIYPLLMVVFVLLGTYLYLFLNYEKLEILFQYYIGYPIEILTSIVKAKTNSVNI